MSVRQCVEGAPLPEGSYVPPSVGHGAEQRANQRLVALLCGQPAPADYVAAHRVNRRQAGRRAGVREARFIARSNEQRPYCNAATAPEARNKSLRSRASSEERFEYLNMAQTILVPIHVRSCVSRISHCG